MHLISKDIPRLSVTSFLMPGRHNVRDREI
nr:MAG TPA: hypothetical protein [Caudoviricetes sp.]